MGATSNQPVNGDGARLRAPSSNAVTDGPLRVIRHKAFEFGLGSFVPLVGVVCSGENCRKLGPGVR